jgi:hypothetical protein
MAAYREEGHPAHDGLWACGVLVWACDGRSRALGDAWWAECLRWGYQDQLSFPVVCRRLGYRPATFPVPLIERTDRRGGLANRWLRINPHLPGTGG